MVDVSYRCISGFRNDMVCPDDETDECPGDGIISSGGDHCLQANVFVVQKSTNMLPCSTFPADTSVRYAVRHIARKFGFESQDIKLMPLQGDENMMALVDTMTGTLCDAGLDFSKDNRNTYVIYRREEPVVCSNRSSPSMAREDDLELGASASPEDAVYSDSPPSDDWECASRAVERIPNREYASQARVLRRMELSRSEEIGDYLTQLLQDGPSPSVAIAVEGKREGREEQRAKRGDSVVPSLPTFRGLVNQAMTCYLNSLLQALYMTPEFRNSLYHWKYERISGLEKSKSIPYQLQKLFLSLQTSRKMSIETTELTRSFGWDSGEAWHQHDIQELCRVMFEALEQEFRGTEEADLINRLYQGKMIDYVKCLECGVEKSREDTFLDIPLPIRSFGSSTSFSNVEEALHAFVKPETLEGNNQYYCEGCQKKCDAHKGLKFTKFPYLLTLHLKRFDFDYSTMHRIKLGDKVTFPETLNLNSLVPYGSVPPSSSMFKEEGSEGYPEEIAGSSSKCDDSSTTDSGSAIDDESCLTSAIDYEQEVDEGIDVSNHHHHNLTDKRSGSAISDVTSGPSYVYELFSIMVHSGSASGGHYYVYIKDFESNEWFCFNDQTVSKITAEDIDRSYGGFSPSRTYYSGAYSSSISAYMLMYRQIDAERNELPLKQSEFPPHLKEILRRMEKDEDEKEGTSSECGADNGRLSRMKKIGKIRVFTQHPHMDKIVDAKVDYSVTATLKEVLEIAHNKFQLDVPLERCRLVLYNSQCDSIEDCLSNKEDKPLASLLYNVEKNELFMDVRPKGKEFIPYESGSILLNIHLVDMVNSRVNEAVKIRFCCNRTVYDLKVYLVEQFSKTGPYKPQIYLFLNTSANSQRFLDRDTQSLKYVGIDSNSKLFLYFGFPLDECSQCECKLTLRELIQVYLNTIRLNVVLPSAESVDSFKKMYTQCLDHENAIKNRKASDSDNATDLVPSDEYDQSTNTGGDGNLMLLLNTPAASNTDVSTLDAQQRDGGINATTGGGSNEHGGDQSTSEDSSLTDSDRTLLGDAREDYQMSSPGSSPPGSSGGDLYGYSSESCYNNKGKDDIDADYTNDPNIFHIKEIVQNETISRKRILEVEVDKRIPVGAFKKWLEPYVGVGMDHFKIYPDCLIGGGDGAETGTGAATATVDDKWPEFQSQVVANFESAKDGDTLKIKLDRVSKPGEWAGKVYLLQVQQQLALKFVCEWVIDGEKLVEDTKRDLLEEVANTYKIEIPLDKCRLFQKGCYLCMPGMIFSNDRAWKSYSEMGNDFTLFIQALDGPEPVKNPSEQVCILIRQFIPSSNTFGPYKEVVCNTLQMCEIKLKLSEMTNIPLENLTLGKINWSSNFTFQNTLCSSDIDWSAMSNVECLDELLVLNADCMLCYKDNREKGTDYAYYDVERRFGKESSRIVRLNNTSLSALRRRKLLPLKINGGGGVKRSTTNSPIPSAPTYGPAPAEDECELDEASPSMSVGSLQAIPLPAPPRAATSAFESSSSSSIPYARKENSLKIRINSRVSAHSRTRGGDEDDDDDDEDDDDYDDDVRINSRVPVYSRMRDEDDDEDEDE